MAFLLCDWDLSTVFCAQSGYTSLMLAVSEGRMSTAQVLVSAGADVNLKDEVSFKWNDMKEI